MDCQYQKVPSLQLLCAKSLLETLIDTGFIDHSQMYMSDGQTIEQVQHNFYCAMEPYLPRRIYENLFTVMKQINVLNWQWDREMMCFSVRDYQYIRCRQRKEDSLSLMCAKKIFSSIKKNINIYDIKRRLTFEQEFVTAFSKYVPHFMAEQLMKLYDRFFLPPIIYDLYCHNCYRFNDRPAVYCKYCKYLTCNVSPDIDSDDEALSDYYSDGDNSEFSMDFTDE
ncbi:hypothetical protein [Trichoplusia ni single nucleopolyhedrovirus]|uniref:Uncharacterized protein n=1 Tax=Trichoplusia ni single nucleopolyhedrovirus TaxID=332054 RepID=Q461V6_9ABAC|nr:hypothetical protein TNSV_gp110 [Trichoplusia ni single nucleopolyhedrovirus]AAZ67480.1 hypothetical protein [Trichoplusia ni single nucleopolyhedrovirus]